QESANPDPGDQRKDVGLNDGRAVFELREIQVEIFVQAAADGYAAHGLACGFVVFAYRLECFQELSVLRNFDNRALPEEIVVVAVLDFTDLQLVTADGEGLAELDLSGHVL